MASPCPREFLNGRIRADGSGLKGYGHFTREQELNAVLFRTEADGFGVVGQRHLGIGALVHDQGSAVKLPGALAGFLVLHVHLQDVAAVFVQGHRDRNAKETGIPLAGDVGCFGQRAGTEHGKDQDQSGHCGQNLLHLFYLQAKSFAESKSILHGFSIHRASTAAVR